MDDSQRHAEWRKLETKEYIYNMLFKLNSKQAKSISSNSNWNKGYSGQGYWLEYNT